MIGVLATTAFLSFVMMAATYIVHLRRSLERLRSMGTPEATLDLGEERFCITSGIGACEMQWLLIRKAWRFDGVWILFFSASGFMLLPTADIPTDAREFILAKAGSAGGTIA